MAFSPKDMDFIEAKHAAAREIALAFGVPPMLLGIPGDNTYANYAEANRALLAADSAAAGGAHGQGLSGWLAPAFGGGACWSCGRTSTRSRRLSTEREALWERVRKSDFLTIDEKRAAVGYGEIDGGDGLSEGRER